VRRPPNALALAVLALLYEQPMHPYEISSTLRFRHKEASIKINYGSLYAVVESLAKKDLIAAAERTRDGRRPERTVYRLTEAGEQALIEWLGELFAEPSLQFTDFEAALSLMPVLTPETVRAHLEQRLATLDAATAEYERMRGEHPGFPRLFGVEGEYQAALRAAEATFVRGLLRDITDGTLDGMPMWRRFHELKAAGDDDLMPRLMKEFLPDSLSG
jgi:DNA-binding PadR family transcriptional regulator